MDKKAIFFSLDENITQAKLKKLNDFDIKNENKIIDYCKKNDIKALVGDEVYLKKTKNVSYILYYIGNLELIKNKKAIGIVGPREITPFIKDYLDKFFSYIKKFKNIVIVSGLADGTDTYAHELSIKYHIPTIAVLGFGIAKGLSSTTRHLIKKIKENNGLIISEFKLKQTGTSWTFPQRNRIIAGLSDFIFSPQAKEKSGTLITIEEANKINIPVYSCFSSIDDIGGKGSNEQIKLGNINGIYDFDIFLNEIEKGFNLQKGQNLEVKNLNLEGNEKIIFENIQKGNNSLEKIIYYTNLDTNTILNTISLLELKQIIKEENGEWKII